MKNLIRKFVSLVLAAGLIGCVTDKPVTELAKPSVSPSISNTKGIDLKNGFFAESYSVFDDIHLMTQVYLKEAVLKKTEKGYEGIKTKTYHTTPTEIYDGTFDLLCQDVDLYEDKILKKFETSLFLDMMYNSMRKLIWVEE